jgi:hypothetical protein
MCIMLLSVVPEQVYGCFQPLCVTQRSRYQGCKAANDAGQADVSFSIRQILPTFCLPTLIIDYST